MLVKIDNILLLGTSHVSKKSVKEIEKTIEAYNPEVVALELDLGRLRRLLSPNKKEKGNHFASIKEFGVGGYLFMLLGSAVQKRIGKQLGIDPGADMKAGYVIARDKKIPTSLIDVDIRITAKRISKIPFTKKVRSAINLFIKSFDKKYRKKLSFDLKDGAVPDQKVMDAAFEVFEKEVPELYNVLIEQRNIHMCNKLLTLQQLHEGHVLAIVGAGHLKGMERYLRNKSNPNLTYSFVTEAD